jgi:hypothetical protein
MEDYLIRTKFFGECLEAGEETVPIKAAART